MSEYLCNISHQAPTFDKDLLASNQILQAGGPPFVGGPLFVVYICSYPTYAGKVFSILSTRMMSVWCKEA
jgi:hypothetical protein